MQQYHELLKKILDNGNVQFEPRTEEHILGISGDLNTYDLRNGFPLMTTKNIPIRLPAEELFWKLRGERNVKSLFDRNVHIWDANAFDHWIKRNGLRNRLPKHSLEWNAEFMKYKEKLANDPEFAADAGDLGPVYGYQWRHGFSRDGKEIDQLTNLIKSIREKPGSRYHVLNAWNPADLPDMALGPCPFWHQFTVYGNQLDLTMIQRSCDVYLGVPFNIAQDALLTHLVANETGFKPRFLRHMTINTHAYLGVPPRSDFWEDKKNVSEFQRRFRMLHVQSRLVRPDKEEYLKLKEWYLKNAPEESHGNERKDHIPFILEQLSKEPKTLPKVEIADMPLMEIIKQPVNQVIKVVDYTPHKWDSKAEMAA